MFIYKEDDWEAEVELLNNLSDATQEKYKLKVIRTVRKSRIYKPTPDGTVFTAFKMRKGGANVHWWLTDPCLSDN